MPAPTERTLWLTLPGAPAVLGLAWAAWVAVAAFAGASSAGPAGVLGVLAVGWFIARRSASPADCLVRVHLDDAEVTVLGPGRRVRRLPWEAVQCLTQERTTVRLEAGGAAVRVPLAPLVQSQAWGAILSRVVPALATELWDQLEEGGEVRLVPSPEPGVRGLAWWAWVPATAACATGPGAPGMLLAVGVVLVERGVAAVRARARTASLRASGLALRPGLRPLFVPWTRADVMHAPQGLLVGPTEGACGLVAASLPNFWAVAPVIETKTRLGPGPGATVHFRVRVAEGRLAVVGEIEPAA